MMIPRSFSSGTPKTKGVKKADSLQNLRSNAEIYPFHEYHTSSSALVRPSSSTVTPRDHPLDVRAEFSLSRFSTRPDTSPAHVVNSTFAQVGVGNTDAIEEDADWRITPTTPRTLSYTQRKVDAYEHHVESYTRLRNTAKPSFHKEDISSRRIIRARNLLLAEKARLKSEQSMAEKSLKDAEKKFKLKIQRAKSSIKLEPQGVRETLMKKPIDMDAEDELRRKQREAEEMASDSDSPSNHGHYPLKYFSPLPNWLEKREDYIAVATDDTKLNLVTLEKNPALRSRGEISLLAKLLCRMEILREFPLQSVTEIAEKARLERTKSGKRIYRENDASDKAYIVILGSVRLLSRSPPDGYENSDLLSSSRGGEEQRNVQSGRLASNDSETLKLNDEKKDSRDRLPMMQNMDSSGTRANVLAVPGVSSTADGVVVQNQQKQQALLSSPASSRVVNRSSRIKTKAAASPASSLSSPPTTRIKNMRKSSGNSDELGRSPSFQKGKQSQRGSGRSSRRIKSSLSSKSMKPLRRYFSAYVLRECNPGNAFGFPSLVRQEEKRCARLLLKMKNTLEISEKLAKGLSFITEEQWQKEEDVEEEIRRETAMAASDCILVSVSFSAIKRIREEAARKTSLRALSVLKRVSGFHHWPRDRLRILSKLFLPLSPTTTVLPPGKHLHRSASGKGPLYLLIKGTVTVWKAFHTCRFVKLSWDMQEKRQPMCWKIWEYSAPRVLSMEHVFGCSSDFIIKAATTSREGAQLLKLPHKMACEVMGPSALTPLREGVQKARRECFKIVKKKLKDIAEERIPPRAIKGIGIPRRRKLAISKAERKKRGLIRISQGSDSLLHMHFDSLPSQ